MNNSSAILSTFLVASFIILAFVLSAISAKALAKCPNENGNCKALINAQSNYLRQSQLAAPTPPGFVDYGGSPPGAYVNSGRALLLTPPTPLPEALTDVVGAVPKKAPAPASLGSRILSAGSEIWSALGRAPIIGRFLPAVGGVTVGTAGAVVGGAAGGAYTSYAVYKAIQASEGVSFTIGGRAESACQLIGFAKDTEGFAKCANSIAKQLNEGVSPADVMLPKDLKAPSQTSSVATTPVATPAAAETQTARPSGTAATQLQYWRDLRELTKADMIPEELEMWNDNIVACDGARGRRCNNAEYEYYFAYKKLPAPVAAPTARPPAAARARAPAQSSPANQSTTPAPAVYQWYGSEKQCTEWYSDDANLHNKCVQGGNQGLTISTINTQGYQAQLDACGYDNKCRDSVIDRMNSDALKQQDDRVRAKNDADYARRLDIYCKGDPECIQREMEAQDDQGIQGVFLPDASREAAKLQEAQQQALESNVVPGGIYDNGVLVGQRTGATADYAPTFKTGWGWFDRVVLQIPEGTPSVPAADKSPFPPDADNLWAAPAGPEESFLSKWFGTRASTEDTGQVQTGAIFDLKRSYTGDLYKGMRLNEYNEDDFGPNVSVWVQEEEQARQDAAKAAETEAWLKELETRPQIVPSDFDEYINTEPTGSTQQIFDSSDYYPDDIPDESYIGPSRQYSIAVPFSNELFNQSLVASAFGAFLLKDKEDNIPARPAREPFGNGL